MFSNNLRRVCLIFVVFALSACCAGPSSGRLTEETEAETEKKAAPSDEKPETEKKVDDLDAANLVAAGRALEGGEVEKGTALLKNAGDSPEALLLLARAAAARGDFEEAVRRYHDLTDRIPELETMRISELADALAKAGRPDEAAATLEGLLGAATDLSKSKRADLMEKRASWLLAFRKTGEAIKVIEETKKIAVGDKTLDRLNLKLARALIVSGDKAKAVSILAPMALKASRAAFMDDALSELKKIGSAPAWTADARLERARTLISFRAWDAATSTIAPLLKGDKKSAVAEEARFVEAQILFKRRRHYKEAVEALGKIAKAGGAHADEAEFMIARALSRLDRDEEAISKYRAFAKKTKRPAKAAEARFLAARLEFYLGKHRPALRDFEALVGNGRKKVANSQLSGDDEREAHFLAGMSALLLKMARRAAQHMEAGTAGTKNAEVLARNRYWSAVALGETDKEAGLKSLQEICGQDGTSWYSILAARRVEELKVVPSPCRQPALKAKAGDGAVQPLESLSPVAGFFARAGFFREAASELKKAEGSSRAKASTRDWIENYVALDAPRFSIAKASAALKWPPDEDEWWLARAAYPAPYEDLVREVESQRGLPGELLWAVARKESLFDPEVISSAGALGMMQMMPHTFEKNRKRAGLPKLGKGEIPGPESSIRAAGFELAELMDRFGGSIPLVIMAYNAGSGAVSRWLDRSGGLPIDVFVEKAGFAQTRNYVRRVFQNLVRYRLLEGKPLPVLPERAEVVKRAKTEAEAEETEPIEDMDAGEIDDRD